MCVPSEETKVKKRIRNTVIGEKLNTMEIVFSFPGENVDE